MLKRIRENKYFRFLSSFLYAILVILILAILLIVILQRVSNNDLAVGGIRIFNIVTGSMQPKYNIGDVLVAKEIDASELKVGDDIVYKGAAGEILNKIITHQIIKIEKENEDYKIITKGLASDIEDPVVSENQILGIIIYKSALLSGLSKVVNNLYSFYFLIFIPFVIYFFFKASGILREFKFSKDKDEIEKDKNVK